MNLQKRVFNTKVTLLFVAYFFAALLGLKVNSINGFATLIWAPSGIAIAGLLIGGLELWPAVLLGAFAVNKFYLAGPTIIAISIALGNTAEAVIAVLVLPKFNFRPSLDRIRDVVCFAIFGTGLNTLVAALVGTLALFSRDLIAVDQILPTFRTWWLGDGLGSLIVAPLLLVWFNEVRGGRILSRTRPQIFEATSMAALTVVIAAWVFAGAWGKDGAAHLPYVFFPIVIWASLRFRQIGIVTEVFLITVICFAASVLGGGALDLKTLHENLAFLNGFLFVTALTGLTLAASISERTRAIFEKDLTEKKLIESHRNLEEIIIERTNELRKMEAQRIYEENERNFRRLLDEVPGLVWVAHPDGTPIFFNRKWTEFTGRDFSRANSVTEVSWPETIMPQDLPASIRAWKTSVINKSVFESEYRLRSKTGEYRWHLARSIPISTNSDQISQWIGIAVDIHDQKTAQQGLEFLAQASEVLNASLDYEETLRNLAPIAVPQLADWCSIDIVDPKTSEPKSISVYHSEPSQIKFAQELRTQYPPDWTAKVGVPEVIRSGKSELYKAISDELLRAGSRDEGEYLLLQRLGITSVIIVPLVSRGTTFGAITLVTSESGRSYTENDLSLAEELARRAGVAIDNARLFAEAETQKNHHFEALQKVERLAQAAEAANQTKSLFLANMSHEIRTPLGAILGFTNLLNDPNITGAEKAKYSDIIARNGRLLTQLIDDILDLSKVEAGRLEVERIEMSLIGLLSEVTSLMGYRAREKGLDLEVHIADSVPEEIFSDPTRLRQILINIIGNAIKFTEQGKIVVSARCDGQKILFNIEDTGPGISSEQRQRIFEWFTQADPSTTRKFGGTGLGLALSLRLARALGGDIVLSEDRAVGTHFLITIPALVDSAKPRRALSEAMTPANGLIKTDQGHRVPKDYLAGIKVLLVEDSPDNRMLIEKILQGRGATVDMASNGREGVTKALSQAYDLILMDIQMPILDGVQATSELRRRGYTKPIVALTAHAMKEERAKTLAAGCNAHLTKPIEINKLLHLVGEFVDR